MAAAEAYRVSSRRCNPDGAPYPVRKGGQGGTGGLQVGSVSGLQVGSGGPSGSPTDDGVATKTPTSRIIVVTIGKIFFTAPLLCASIDAVKIAGFRAYPAETRMDFSFRKSEQK